MRFSDATGRKVVSTATAATVGKIDGFVVDPKSRAVLAVHVKKSAGGGILAWSDITAFGADAVTVADTDPLTDAGDDVAALSGKDHQLVGKRVLSTTGDELGKVDDIEFDPESGALTTLLLAETDVAGARLVGVGSYAVVVSAE